MRLISFAKLIREDMGMTQRKVAEKLGWKLRRYASYERLEREPNVSDALQIAAVLNVPVEIIWRVVDKKTGL